MAARLRCPSGADDGALSLARGVADLAGLIQHIDSSRLSAFFQSADFLGEVISISYHAFWQRFFSTLHALWCAHASASVAIKAESGDAMPRCMKSRRW